MGTSLTVHPFASLTGLVPEECPRFLINLDHVGGWGSRANDVACLMPCDKAVRQLCSLLGWEEELDALWAETDISMKKRITAAPEERDGEKAPAEEWKEAKNRLEEEDRVEGGKEKEEVAEVEVEETEETRGEEKESAIAQAKNVHEGLLAEVIDKLAETIGRVGLEEQLEAKSAERKGSSGQQEKPISKTSEEPSVPSDASPVSTEIEASSTQEPESRTNNSIQSGKL